METPDSPSDMSSPESAQKISSPAKLDDKGKSTHIRFLVSNAEAGSVIGKGGATITDFQSQTGARIQLSRNHEFFPGTSDRIVMISGTTKEIIDAFELILTKLINELHGVDDDDVDSRFKVRLIVPNSSCGGIIGKGGSIIKSFIEDSQAIIKISPQDHKFIGLSDRLVTVIGSFHQQKRVILLVLSKLTEDAHYTQTIQAPFSYSGFNFSGFHGMPVGYVIPPLGTVAYNIHLGSDGYDGKFQKSKMSMISSKSSSKHQDDRDESIVIGVADEYIGAVLGRGGRTLTEISQASGARIKISNRGDFMSGTTDRKVTITGTHEAIGIAESMIMRKTSSNS